ncbi:MAG: hypothetical protein AB7G87_00535 [Clostridia bacterium]
MLPDILGYKLEEAKKILLLNEFSDIKINVTKAPFNSQYSSIGDCRILRAEELENHSVELLVCYL